jgi:hypothetical protein
MKSCNSKSSCNGMNARKDLIANSKFKKVMEEYNQGKLKSGSGAPVNSPSQAKAIAASESGQSYNEQTKKSKNYDRYGMRDKK